MRTTTIVLTAGADRHVRDHDLALALDLLQLPEGCANGDLVSLEAGKSARHDFSVIRRRWVAAGNNTKLEITLDYPAASPRR